MTTATKKLTIIDILHAERDAARSEHSKCAAQVRELEIQLANLRMLQGKLANDALVKGQRVTLLEGKEAERETVCNCGAHQATRDVTKNYCSWCGHPLHAKRIL